MQFVALAAIFTIALAADGLLGPRVAQPFCSSINGCITTNGNATVATSFCATYNSIPTVTSGTSTVFATPTDCCDIDKRANVFAHILAPTKARCFKKFLDGRLSAACSCLSIPTQTVAEETTTVTAECATAGT
ncbi:hypothetical protein LTR09_003880 [Extremus antarcticus]|uniref:Uncharacterized protein n=1 Tax=Extremus antarcticus TaxID=702011 RepID=A0AAJ0DJK4_9PEZI|nr:hypothetical protein LTR09_003880 [Extremus antarcticus]